MNMVTEVSQKISNFCYMENPTATKELMELFDRISKKPLNTAQDYIKMYDDSFYTFKTFDGLVKSEEDQSDGLTREECAEQLNQSIWQLHCGWYVQYV